MTVEQLFQKLSSKEFKDTENGDLLAQLQISVAYFCSIGLYFLV